MSKVKLNFVCKECGRGSQVQYGICPYCKAIDAYVKPEEVKSDNQFDNQLEMFLWIWSVRPHISELSGKDLNKVPENQFISIFAHLLSKAQNRYPHYKLNPDNIAILTPEEHQLFDAGSIDAKTRYEKENNCSFDVLHNRCEELKKLYK